MDSEIVLKSLLSVKGAEKAFTRRVSNISTCFVAIGQWSNCQVVDKDLQLEKRVKCFNKDEDKINEWRRQCGCIRTSDKLRRILDTFPSPPPPSPTDDCVANKTTCVSAFCAVHQPVPFRSPVSEKYKVSNTDGAAYSVENIREQTDSRSWRVVSELVQLVQLSVTATALALYYLIYCYMQLVYFTLRSALYFHNADGPMKITIGVVTLTTLLVAFNLLLRVERLLWF